jgi:membrane protease YdiL (CAAX protease family)
MPALVMAAGAVGVVVAWRFVSGGRSLWWSMAIVNGTFGLLGLVLGSFEASPRLHPFVAGMLGVGVGGAMWAATRAFVGIAARWPPFARHTSDLYDQRAGLSLTAAVTIAALVVAPGEELFWRGLFQTELAEETSRTSAALLTWAAYAVANAASFRLPIIAGGIVGGAVWGGLAWCTEGVMASTACHVVWTGMMLVVPPRQARR